MTKSELKTGHVVTYRNGEKRAVYKDTCYGADYLTDGHTYRNLYNYKEDLTCSTDPMCDIVKVESTGRFVDIARDPNGFSGIVIWERPTPKKMTVSEIESILGYKIEIIAEKENYYE